MTNINDKAPYDLIAHHWAKHRIQLPKKDQLLFDHFYNALPTNSFIIDLGCGSGIPICQQLIQRGFRVLGVDRSKKLLDLACENIPDSQFIKSEIEVFEFDKTIKKYQQPQGIVCWDVLFHLPKNQQLLVLKKITAALPLNGKLIISSGGSKQNLPPFTDTMFDVEFFYDAFPISELADLCHSLGLEIIQESMVNIPDGGRDKGRIGLIFNKFSE